MASADCTLCLVRNKYLFVGYGLSGENAFANDHLVIHFSTIAGVFVHSLPARRMTELSTFKYLFNIGWYRRIDFIPENIRCGV